MQEQELFQSYEVKNWDFNPRIYKILAASAIFNILALLVVAQTNLLTTKGCDSPLVGGVCQVLDTLYVGGTVLTTDRGYVNEPYAQTEIDDAEIIWVDRTGDEDFKYPEGYFALSNPELMVPQEITTADGSFPANIPGMNVPGIQNPTLGGGGNLLEKPQELPPPNKNAITGDMPTSPFGFDNPTTKPGKVRQTRPQKFPNINKKSPNVLPNVDGDQTANTENKDPNKTVNPTKTEDDPAIVINKKPLHDLKGYVNDLRNKNEVSLSSPFSVQAKGKLNKDGKIDTKNFKFTYAESPDKNMLEVVKKSIASISDSGYLQYLTTLSGKDLEFNFSQDGTALTAVIQSELESNERANTISTALKFLIGLSKGKKEKAIASMQAANKPEDQQNLQDELDDLELLKNATIKNDGKKIVIQFVVPQEIATKMIERKLNEPEEKSTEPKPNGNTGQLKENKQTTTK